MRVNIYIQEFTSEVLPVSKMRLQVAIKEWDSLKDAEKAIAERNCSFAAILGLREVAIEELIRAARDLSNEGHVK